MSDVNEALRKIEESGWKLNNLMYLDNGLYRASLRDKDNGFEFGQDHDPGDALLVALRHAIEGRHEPLITGSGGSETMTSNSPARKSQNKESYEVDL